MTPRDIHDNPMTATYVKVVIVEAAIIVFLWYLGWVFA
jgi:hypothetical protein